jgi:hypothetical protein|tara:strand:+ start:28576 stop:28917 length:342 start_codon:yes stop_codon:yes gene_type:complete
MIVMAKKGIYKILLIQLGEIYELYAQSIFQSDLYGFIEIEEYLFDQNSKILVDPSEEKLKSEFKGVKRSYIPIGSIIRIDEVDEKGNPKITEHKGDKVTSIPNILDGGFKKKD